MKLVSFAVRNYRSITKTSKLPIREGVTALIGPNNEGKSNILRALVTSMKVASRLQQATVTKQGKVLVSFDYIYDWIYDWEKDFPVGLQKSKPEGASEFDLEFELSADEVAEFREEVGSSLNGTLPIRLSVSRTALKFSVRKQGRGASALSAKSRGIAAFIGKRIDFEYVPAIRPASVATSVVKDMVSRELQALASDPDYRKAIAKIDELQQPLLRSISETVRDTLKAFLPNVKDVEVVVPPDARSRALTKCEVIVDDGTPTNLATKGDGVQSLAALSLMRRASQRTARGKQLIFAVEEPESHLHPNAIHRLRGVLSEIATQHQVILTTHCAVFVNRSDLGANILVTENSAAPPTSVHQIRESLGVRVSDNLRSAEVVLLVEGECDRISMRALLTNASPTLAQAVAAGTLSIDSLLGGSNLSYKLSQVRDAMCIVHSLVDDDSAGRIAVQRAQTDDLLQLADLTLTATPGMREAELEDWYDHDMYTTVFATEFGVPQTSPHFTSTRRKWTDRMRHLFTASGKGWDARTESLVKQRVVDLVVANPSAAIHRARRGPLEALITALESKLKRA